MPKLTHDDARSLRALAFRLVRRTERGRSPELTKNERKRYDATLRFLTHLSDKPR